MIFLLQISKSLKNNACFKLPIYQQSNNNKKLKDIHQPFLFSVYPKDRLTDRQAAQK